MALLCAKNQVPPEIEQAEKTYFWMAKWLQLTMIALGVIASVASLVVATFGNIYLNDEGTKSVAFVAALASGLLTLFSMSKKNQEVWAAWRMLNAAILRYKYVDDSTPAQLIDTWEAAEKILGNATLSEK